MKVTSFLVSAFLALASGHYVDEEPQSEPRVYEEPQDRFEEPPENHVRSHHNTDYQGEPRVHHNTDYESEPRVYHNTGYQGEPRVHHNTDYQDEPRVHETHQRSKETKNLRNGAHEKRPRTPIVEERNTPQYNVLIVGAGAAGLSAAHMFDHAGWNYKVLEAHATEIGGRTRRSDKFGFGIDLGAEFIHTNENVGSGTYHDSPYKLLQEMIKDPLDQKYKTLYTKQEPKQYTPLPSGVPANYHNPPEYRWAGDMTWYDFLTQEVAYDAVRNNIIKGCEVNYIDAEGNGVTVKCKNGSTYTASHVIVTVPINILKKNMITFKGGLPATYTAAINNIKIGGAFKIWMEFKKPAGSTKPWYPNYFMKDADVSGYKLTWNEPPNEDSSKDPKAGYRYFFNEMWPYKDSTDAKYDKYILGALIYGYFETLYAGKSDAQIYDAVVKEIKDISLFNTNKGEFVPGSYKVQNWSNSNSEPFIQSGYTIWANWKDQRLLMTPLHDNQLLFAGEALNDVSWGSVHGAAMTGRKQAQVLIDLDRRQ